MKIINKATNKIQDDINLNDKFNTVRRKDFKVSLKRLKFIIGILRRRFLEEGK